MSFRFLVLGILSVALSGCGWQMAEQPRYDEYEPSSLVQTESSAKIPPTGTVAAHSATADQPKLSAQLLQRGKERFTIYCALCHGDTGHGNGRIVQHGFPPPPSFLLDRLKTAEDLHFWSVITNGAGRMYPYADRVSPQDRWAIVAWIRVLQTGGKANLNEMSDDLKERVLKELNKKPEPSPEVTSP